ncbi:MAG: ANTAR domain-containing protein [Gammaproteobacteria bacterium]|nr:ANTAR domain-containing protein [Gammaproteobacteria bacterium]
MKLRVMLVDDHADRAALLERALAGAGYQVVATVAAGEDLYRRVAEIQPDVVIIDMESPGRDTLEHMRNISRDQPKPIVMFADNSDRAMIEAAVQAGVSAYIVDGLNGKRVKPIVEVAIARFKEFQALRRELEQAKTTLVERKTIERAKGILMKQRGWTEEQAYQALRKMAMDRNLRVAEVANQVIAMVDLLG